MSSDAALPPAVERAQHGKTGLWAAALAVSGTLAYLPVFRVPFIFDDQPAIVDNPAIRHLLPLSRVLFPPASGIGANGASGRPLVGLSLALNYAWGGLDVWGYHAVNLAIHVLAGLVLFGILRRTFVGRTRLAFAAALLWLLHPLQTETVVCPILRNESMMGLFYLLTLYCFLRYAEMGPSFAPPSGASAGEKTARRGRKFWCSTSCLACLLGMASKETMVTAPVIVLLYDRTFVAGTFAEAWRRRRLYYGCLFATWVFLAALLVLEGGSRGAAAGLGLGVSSWQYALTQCRAIFLYLKLTFWPHPLVLDYGVPLVPGLGSVFFRAAGVVLLVAGSLWALMGPPASTGRRALGFAGAWFFLILAPSSSVVPLVAQTMAEHRMYLPLAGILAVAVWALGRWAARWFWPAVAAVGVALALTTLARVAEYREPLAFLRQQAVRVPDNVRAIDAYGYALSQAGKWNEAAEEERRALAIAPGYIRAESHLASDYWQLNRKAEALPLFEQASGRGPEQAESEGEFGNALLEAGQVAEGVSHLRRAEELAPHDARIRCDLGTGLLAEGDVAGAKSELNEAVRLDPSLAVARFDLGHVAQAEQNWEAALDCYRTALRLNPALGAAEIDMGGVYMRLRRMDEGADCYRAALRIDPANAEAHCNLGAALSLLGRPEEAIPECREALRLHPGYASAHANLARALHMLGRNVEARAELAEARREMALGQP